MSPHHFLTWLPAVLLLTACGTQPVAPENPADLCSAPSGRDFSQVLPCYLNHLANQPLNYQQVSDARLPGLELRRYRLISQTWSPENLVQPAQWTHGVDIYIPDNPISRRAVLIVNNGINHGSEGLAPSPADDFTQENLAQIARSTRSIVVAVSDVPNQYLTMGGKPPSREDVSVAQSWDLFMAAPSQRAIMPLQVPMVGAVAQAMSLAEKELGPWAVDQFILSGASKRGWSVWLTALADSRVVAIAPLVIDILDTQTTLKHMYRTYGGNWPVAFAPYHAEGITERIDSEAFTQLMQIHDPLRYAGTDYQARLSIPKYLINASGDDFFLPDNAGRYYERLTGEKALRMLPNADHGGIRKVNEPALIAFINRLQRNAALPQIRTRFHSQHDEPFLTAEFSEPPTSLELWRAHNPVARDFRYACGIRYVSETLALAGEGSSFSVKLPEPSTGWQAYFVEATFSDGFVATTPAFVTPEDQYPTQPPPSDGGRCQTLPGR